MLGGPRFNQGSTDEGRRSASNLLLLCHRHHKETDDIVRFDVAALRKIKLEHEAHFAESPFKVNEAFLYRLQAEMDEYWSALEQSNRDAHVVSEFSISVPIAPEPFGVFEQLKKKLARIDEIHEYLADSDAALNAEIRGHIEELNFDLAPYDAVPYYSNPFVNRNWEMHALATRNTMTDIYVAVRELEVRFYEEYLKTHPCDAGARQMFDAAKLELEKIAVSSGYAD